MPWFLKSARRTLLSPPSRFERSLAQAFRFLAEPKRPCKHMTGGDPAAMSRVVQASADLTASILKSLTVSAGFVLLGAATLLSGTKAETVFLIAREAASCMRATVSTSTLIGHAADGA